MVFYERKHFDEFWQATKEECVVREVSALTHLATLLSRNEVLQMVSSHFKSLRYNGGKSLLHLAAISSNVETIQFLLESGCSSTKCRIINEKKNVFDMK